MPPKSKKEWEDRLAKQRMYQWRRYIEIKNDTELLAVEKEKRRQNYLKKKAENNLKNLLALLKSNAKGGKKIGIGATLKKDCRSYGESGEWHWKIFIVLRFDQKLHGKWKS